MRNAFPDLQTPATAAARVRSVELSGPSGRLEAILNEGDPAAAYTALICHPHPLGGGNLHNKVVYHAMKTCNDPAWGFGLPVLRFNFRGTDRSAGSHDGLGESADILAALDWLDREFGKPIVLAGYSFGAAMALKAAGELLEPRKVKGLALLGFPVSGQFPQLQNPDWLRTPLPKLFLSGDRDQFASPQKLKQTAAAAADPKRLVILPGADHFFTGQLDPMQRALADWLKELLL